MRTIFVTGGSGFVGRNLLPALRERGDTVRALARGDSAASVVSALGATPVRGDLNDGGALREGMRGADLVIHAAGHIAEWGARDLFDRINVRGTRSVLAAAQDAGVPRLVFLSTNAVVIDGSPLVRVDESRPASPRAYARYCASKAAAERLVLAANSATLLTTAIRPAVVWGPGDTSMLPQYVGAVRAGRWMWIGGGRHLAATCHIQNVVDAVLCAAEHGRGGEAYYVTDGEPVVFRDFMTRMLGSQGVAMGDRQVPYRVARVLGQTIETVWDTLRLPGTPPLTRLSVTLTGEELTFVDTKARRELGYASRMTIEDGLRELERLGPPAAHERK